MGSAYITSSGAARDSVRPAAAAATRALRRAGRSVPAAPPEPSTSPSASVPKPFRCASPFHDLQRALAAGAAAQGRPKVSAGRPWEGAGQPGGGRCRQSGCHQRASGPNRQQLGRLHSTAAPHALHHPAHARECPALAFSIPRVAAHPPGQSPGDRDAGENWSASRKWAQRGHAWVLVSGRPPRRRWPGVPPGRSLARRVLRVVRRAGLAQSELVTITSSRRDR